MKIEVENWLITCLISNSICVFILLSNIFGVRVTQAEANHHQRCSNRLEAALKNMRRRALQVKTSRLLSDLSPYEIYHSIYGTQNGPDPDKHYETDRTFYAKHFSRGVTRPNSGDTRDAYVDYNTLNKSPKLSSPRVQVEGLRVKLPQSVSSRWVEVEKCKFSTENSTLDTRLIFPDLTISGRVILQPNGEKCSMILRLRRAGIEFRTTPIGFENFGNEESRRIGSASVRTDSHFAEPGFISVFAHSCQLATGNKLRRNSKRRFGHSNTNTLPNADFYSSTPDLFIGGNRGGKQYSPYRQPATFDIPAESIRNQKTRDHTLDWDHVELTSRGSSDLNARYIQDTPSRSSGSDQIHFNDDILTTGEDFQHLVEGDARAFADDFTTRERGSTEADEVLAKDMENLFSMGVKGLLTTYMQKSLQPAIKETLMENMGYTLSYG